MKCKNCGAHLKGKHPFCPKCGKEIKQKSKAWIVAVIILFALVGAGAWIYFSGNYRMAVMLIPKTNENENVVADSQVTENVQAAAADEDAFVAEETDDVIEYLTNLKMEPIEMTIGETYQIELEKDITDVIWSSSEESVVRVTDGQLTAMSPGKATVTLSALNKEVPVEVTVDGFPDLTLAVNCSKTFNFEGMANNIRLESSAPEIVSVDSGVIYSLQAGSAEITAYINDIPYTFEVVATTPDITTTSVRKVIGSTQQVAIMGTKGKVEWKSDNEAIATVSDAGLITAEPTGAGQSTTVHAYVDGMEFLVSVDVEPIPQLSSTYKMYGHQDNDKVKNAKITLCANANETISFNGPETSVYRDETIENVLNVADVDYGEGLIYPLYHAFMSKSKSPDNENYTEVYLVGTSQTAEVMAQCISSARGITKAKSIVTYEACEDYGIIRIYNHEYHSEESSSYDRVLVSVAVDGYQYQFVVDPPGGNSMGRFSYVNIDQMPADYMIEECSVDAIVVSDKVNVNYSALQANSKSFIPGEEWVERIGTKFVEELEDQAIEMAVGALLKCIFL